MLYRILRRELKSATHGSAPKMFGSDDSTRAAKSLRQSLCRTCARQLWKSGNHDQGEGNVLCQMDGIGMIKPKSILARYWAHLTCLSDCTTSQVMSTDCRAAINVLFVPPPNVLASGLPAGNWPFR